MTTVDACLPCIARHRSRAAAPGYRTCDSCSDQIRDDLAKIRDYWPRLDPSYRPVTDDDGPLHSVPHSKSPANDHILTLTDARSAWNHTVYSAPAVLGSWVQMISEDTGQGYRDTNVPGLARWLGKMHAHATRQLWVDDYAEELGELVHAMSPAATGEGQPRFIGLCPNQLNDDRDDYECRTPLWLPPKDDRGNYRSDTITCSACRSTWPRPKWELLARALQQEAS